MKAPSPKQVRKRGQQQGNYHLDKIFATASEAQLPVRSLSVNGVRDFARSSATRTIRTNNLYFTQSSGIDIFSRLRASALIC